MRPVFQSLSVNFVLISEYLNVLPAVRMAIPGLSFRRPIASKKEKLIKNAKARSIRRSRP